MIDLKPYRWFGAAERQAVLDVMDSGVLSGFVAGPPGERGKEVNGGPQVQSLEAEWAKRYGVKHAISFNSATSALLAAYVAANVRRGDHVITTPWTMSATVAAAKYLGAEIDFADIEEETFCLDPARVVEIVERNARDGIVTQAIIAVNLFGHPAQVARLCEIAACYPGMTVIEDSAQTPLAQEHGRIAGTIGHIGVYSLNAHKHIQCGEGGIAVTNDDVLAERMRSVRNHGVDPLGLNLRMTELEAAVARVQLKHIDYHVRKRRVLGETLSGALRDVMEVPQVRPGCDHDFYLWTAKTGRWPADVPCIRGYIQPLNRIFADGVSCSVTERMRARVVCFETCRWDISDPSRLIAAIRDGVR